MFICLEGSEQFLGCGKQRRLSWAPRPVISEDDVVAPMSPWGISTSGALRGLRFTAFKEYGTLTLFVPSPEAGCGTASSYFPSDCLFTTSLLADKATHTPSHLEEERLLKSSEMQSSSSVRTGQRRENI